MDQSDLSLPRPPLGERGEGPLAVRHECLDAADAVDRQVFFQFFFFFKSRSQSTQLSVRTLRSGAKLCGD